MAKFKKGDRVRNLKANKYVPKGAIGVVDEHDLSPFVIWDEVTGYVKNSVRTDKMRWSQSEDFLELIEENKIDNNKTNIMITKCAVVRLSDQELRIKAMEFAIAIHLTSEGMDSLAKKFEAIYNLIKTTN